jgi:hypothetical protein
LPFRHVEKDHFRKFMKIFSGTIQLNYEKKLRNFKEESISIVCVAVLLR